MATPQRPQFTLEERVFSVCKYSETRSPLGVIRKFQVRFPARHPPFRPTVTMIMQNTWQQEQQEI